MKTTKSPFTKHYDGAITWNICPDDLYIVTGIDRTGKRFKATYNSWVMAKNINVWQGTKWLLRNGKRYKIQTICN